MSLGPGQLAWKLMVELRKELVESQKIRTQIIGLKITFVSAAIGLVGANLGKIPGYLLLIAPFAALFFDLIIASYSFSIKRIGYYIRKNIEPILKSSNTWPDDVPMWEEYMGRPSVEQHLASWGNFGITLLSTVIGIAGLFVPCPFSLPLFWKVGLVSLLLALILVVYVFPRRQFSFDTQQ